MEYVEFVVGLWLICSLFFITTTGYFYIIMYKIAPLISGVVLISDALIRAGYVIVIAT